MICPPLTFVQKKGYISKIAGRYTITGFNGMKNVHVVSDMEMSIAIRKHNISLQVFDTIEKNFVIQNEKTSEIQKAAVSLK